MTSLHSGLQEERGKGPTEGPDWDLLSNAKGSFRNSLAFLLKQDVNYPSGSLL